jgi:hypothetical protein
LEELKSQTKNYMGNESETWGRNCKNPKEARGTTIVDINHQNQTSNQQLNKSKLETSKEKRSAYTNYSEWCNLMNNNKKQIKSIMMFILETV